MQFLVKGPSPYFRTSSSYVKEPGSSLPIEFVTDRSGQDDYESMDQPPYSPDLAVVSSISVGSLTSTKLASDLQQKPT